MKRIMMMIAILVVGLVGCHETTIGFLETKNAEYSVDSLVVRRNLDPKKTPDKNMLTTGANWVSNPIGGVLGTEPLIYSIEGVKALDGGDATLFEEQVWVIGGGRIYFPSKEIKAPNGKYLISLRGSNSGYSAVLKDVFRVIIKEK